MATPLTASYKAGTWLVLARPPLELTRNAARLHKDVFSVSAQVSARTSLKLCPRTAVACVFCCSARLTANPPSEFCAALRQTLAPPKLLVGRTRAVRQRLDISEMVSAAARLLETDA